MLCTARTIIILMLALRAVDAKHNYCGNGFAEAEMQAEMRLYQSNQQLLSSIFKDGSRLVAQVISFIMSDKQPLLQLYQQLPGQLMRFNSFFVNWLLVVVFVVVCSLVAKHFAHKLGCDDCKISLSFVPAKTIRAVVIAVGFLVLLEGYAGISGAFKQQKSLNQMLCSLYSEPIGMLRSSQQTQDFQQFRKQLQMIDKQVVKMLKLYQPIIDKLLHSNEAVKVSKLVLPQLSSSSSNSTFATQFSSSFGDLEALNDRITQTQISYWHKQCYQAELYSHNLILTEKIIIKGLENYGSNKGFHRLIRIYTFIVIVFYGCAMLASATLIFSTIRNKEKAEILNDQQFSWMQYILVMLILACACVFLLTSIALPHLHWLRNSARYATANSSNFYQQMDLLTKKSSEITEVASFMLPLNKSFPDVYGRKFQNMAKEIDDIVSPYLAKNDTYFYGLLRQSLANIADENIRTEVSLLIQQKAVKEPYIAYFNQIVSAHEQILEVFEMFSVVNGGAYGKVIKQFAEVACMLLINRSVEAHAVCGNLIVLLSGLALLLWLSVGKQEDMQVKEQQGEQMGEMGAINDMNQSQ